MDTIAHLLRHDSTYGTWQRRVDTDGEFLAVDDRPLRVLQQPDPARLDWGALGVDVVVEATGHFRAASTPPPMSPRAPGRSCSPHPAPTSTPRPGREP